MLKNSNTGLDKLSIILHEVYIALLSVYGIYVDNIVNFNIINFWIFLRKHWEFVWFSWKFDILCFINIISNNVKHWAMIYTIQNLRYWKIIHIFRV